MTFKDLWAKLTSIIPADKLLHIAAGFFIGALAYRVTHLFSAAWAAAAIVGILKEMWDRYQNIQLAKQEKPPAHDVDPVDAVATIVGGIIGSGAVWVAVQVFS